jgi:hypothetical protein
LSNSASFKKSRVPHTLHEHQRSLGPIVAAQMGEVQVRVRLRMEVKQRRPQTTRIVVRALAQTGSAGILTDFLVARLR